VDDLLVVPVRSGRAQILLHSTLIICECTSQVNVFRLAGAQAVITAAASYDELQRRFEANGAEAIAVAAHPGDANTNLQDEIGERWYAKPLVPLVRRMMQSTAMGTLPTIRAAVDPNAKGGQYYFLVQGSRWTTQPVFFESCLRRPCTGKASGCFHRTEQASSIQGLVNPPLGKKVITTNIIVIKLNPQMTMILPVQRARYQHKGLRKKSHYTGFGLFGRSWIDNPNRRHIVKTLPAHRGGVVVWARYSEDMRNAVDGVLAREGRHVETQGKGNGSIQACSVSHMSNSAGSTGCRA
jgi:hypothetical protein